MKITAMWCLANISLNERKWTNMGGNNFSAHWHRTLTRLEVYHAALSNTADPHKSTYIMCTC